MATPYADNHGKTNAFRVWQGTFWESESGPPFLVVTSGPGVPATKRGRRQRIAAFLSSYSAPDLERVDQSYPSVVLRLSAMDRVKFHQKFRRNFGLLRNRSRMGMSGLMVTLRTRRHPTPRPRVDQRIRRRRLRPAPRPLSPRTIAVARRSRGAGKIGIDMLGLRLAEG